MISPGRFEFFIDSSAFSMSFIYNIFSSIYVQLIVTLSSRRYLQWICESLIIFLIISANSHAFYEISKYVNTHRRTTVDI